MDKCLKCNNGLGRIVYAGLCDNCMNDISLSWAERFRAGPPAEGDKVRYFPLKNELSFKEAIVIEVNPKGIPSFPYPMVKLLGFSGYIDAAHCEVIQ